MFVNLISDTVTRPTPAMLEVMFRAEVGDDVFGEDPTVRALEEKIAALFQKEAAVFCPSGTMTNQIAVKVHTRPLDEIVMEESSHVYQYETGGYAFHSGVGVNLLRGTNGKITAQQVDAAIKPLYDWLPRTSLVILENTCNKGGGSYYTLEEMEPVSALCRARNLKLHLDGARIFNALVETGTTPAQIGSLFDSISVCLSKGLGAPVGSLLLGDSEFIRQARRVRKVMGGGMRQAGYLAAAGIYALDHHVERLRDDHMHARTLGDALQQCSFVENIRPVQTNILIFDVKPPFSAASFLDQLAARQIKATAFGPQTVRFVTHLDFTGDMLAYTCAVLKEMGA